MTPSVPGLVPLAAGRDHDGDGEQRSDAPRPCRGQVLVARRRAGRALHDDDVEDRRYVVVGPVSAVAEALTIIDSEPPDAAVLDLQFAAGTRSRLPRAVDATYRSES